MSEPKAQQEPSMEEILASIRRIISEDEPAEGDKAEGSAAEPDSDDVLELTEVAEDEPAEEPAEAGADEPENAEETADEIDFDAPAEPDEDLELREEMEPEPAEEPVMEEPVAEEPVVEEPAVEEPPPVAAAASAESALLGANPASAAAGSLASLVQAVDRAHSTPLGDANRTIEDLVKEVMRPMIREWLDENLPSLVERLVRREIERLSRTAEGDD